MNKSILSAIVSAAILAITQASLAGEVTGLTSFTANTPARAAEVNGNFSAVKTAVDNNHARVTTLEAQNTALNNRIAALEAKLANMTVTTVNGQPTVQFSGVNVQVVNGQGLTATANGTGNIIIGYDAIRDDTRNFCSIGLYVDQTTCQGNSGIWTISHKSGSHYLVVGDQNNYSRWGGVVIGYRNTSNYNFASVSGGYGNTSSGDNTSVSGGLQNTARGVYTSVSGGYGNTTSGSYTSVSGGSANTAGGSAASSVSGGYGNTAQGIYSSVSGGDRNTADTVSGSGRTSVCGGSFNTATGSNTSICGGANNTANGAFASVSGGQYNTASGTGTHISGGGNGTLAGGNTADQNYSSILGGVSQNTSAVGQTIPALP